MLRRDGSFEVHAVRPVPYEIPTDGLGRELPRGVRPARMASRAPPCPDRGFRLPAAHDDGLRRRRPWLDDDAIGSVTEALVISSRRGETGGSTPSAMSRSCRPD